MRGSPLRGASVEMTRFWEVSNPMVDFVEHGAPGFEVSGE
jgi:hypothetical protein